MEHGNSHYCRKSSKAIFFPKTFQCMAASSKLIVSIILRFEKWKTDASLSFAMQFALSGSEDFPSGEEKDRQFPFSSTG